MDRYESLCLIPHSSMIRETSLRNSNQKKQEVNLPQENAPKLTKLHVHHQSCKENQKNLSNNQIHTYVRVCVLEWLLILKLGILEA